MESKDEILNIIRASKIIIEIVTFILKTKCYFFPMLLFIRHVLLTRNSCCCQIIYCLYNLKLLLFFKKKKLLWKKLAHFH